MDNKHTIEPVPIDPERIHELCLKPEPERYDKIWEYVHEIKVPFVKILAATYNHDWELQVALLLANDTSEDEIRSRNMFEEKHIKAGKEFFELQKEKLTKLMEYVK